MVPFGLFEARLLVSLLHWYSYKSQTECQFTKHAQNRGQPAVTNSRLNRHKSGKDLELTPLRPNMNHIEPAIRNSAIAALCTSRIYATPPNKPTVGTQSVMVQ